MGPIKAVHILLLGGLLIVLAIILITSVVLTSPRNQQESAKHSPVAMTGSIMCWAGIFVILAGMILLIVQRPKPAAETNVSGAGVKRQKIEKHGHALAQAGMGRKIKLALTVVVFFAALAIVLLAGAIILPTLLGPETSAGSAAMTILPLLVVLSLIIGGLANLVTNGLCLYEIAARSRNERLWRIAWSLLLVLAVFLGVFGLLISGGYFFLGRKSLMLSN